MKLFKFTAGLALVLWLPLLYSAGAEAQPACKGSNKNDPGCPGTEEPPADLLLPDAIESVSVDWLNQSIVIRGSGLLAASEFRVGGSAPLAIAASSDSEVVIDFDAALAAAVSEAGNYVLFADGSVALNVYFESAVVDPAATDCPCLAGWSAEPGVRWGGSDTACLEVPGPGVNDYADIAGTVLDVSLDASIFPQFAVGASFVPGEPSDSVCSLVQINGDGSTAVLLGNRINEAQQGTCAIELQANVCQ